MDETTIIGSSGLATHYRGEQALSRSRTLDGLSSATSRADGLRQRLAEMLERVCPIPCSLANDGGRIAAPAPPPSYAGSLQSLQDQLAEISNVIEALEGHI